MTENAPGEKEGNGKQGAASGEPSRLSELAAALGSDRGRAQGQVVGHARGPAPVESWHPPYCGDIDLRIAADGTWHYGGTPITRRPLVELFAGILRRDPERYVLVTPVECVGITVEDAPFVAVAMVRDAGAPDGQAGQANGAARLRFVTNVGDEVEAGADTPLRFEAQPDGGVRPYVLVRGGLWARLTRSLAIDLLGAVVEEGGKTGVRSGAAFFPIEAAGSA